MKTLLLTAGLLLSGTVHASDTLWQRAVALSAYNRDAVPGDWVERQEIFDLEGESHLVLRTHVGFSQTHSKIDVTLIEATSNGIDLTSELREGNNVLCLLGLENRVGPPVAARRRARSLEAPAKRCIQRKVHQRKEQGARKHFPPEAVIPAHANRPLGTDRVQAAVHMLEARPELTSETHGKPLLANQTIEAAETKRPGAEKPETASQQLVRLY